MRKSVDGDYLPAMRQEAIDLRELAKAADRPGMGDMLRQIAEGYEGACQVIEQLRKELANQHHKIAHGCANFYCPDCDKPREIEGYIAADPMDV